MRLSLEEWQDQVLPHLDLIAAGAEMCRRHAKRLPLRPPPETWAEDELHQCETTLVEALAKVRAALEIYLSKPVDG